MTYPYEANTETVHMNGDDLFARVSCQMRNVLSTQITSVLFIALSINAPQTDGVIGVIIDKNGSPITDSQQKANAFNVFFASVGVIDNNVVPHCENITLCSVLDSIIINETDVIRSIDKLRSNSSCGPDSLPPVLFKRLEFCLSLPLTLMYNQLISVGAVPEEWLSAHVTPVFKKGQSGDISNYRPISLPYLCAK